MWVVNTSPTTVELKPMIGAFDAVAQMPTETEGGQLVRANIPQSLNRATLILKNENRLVEYLAAEKLNRDFFPPSPTVPNVTYKRHMSVTQFSVLIHFDTCVGWPLTF